VGADPYWYYVPYEEDKNGALQKLRLREFEAGRYYPVMYAGDLEFPLDDLDMAPSPGKAHEAIEEAMEEAAEQGTGSILDLEKTSEKGYQGVAHILNRDDLTKYFNTDKPTRQVIEENLDNVWDDIRDNEGVRGVGICVPVYSNGAPAELLFMGYSYD